MCNDASILKVFKFINTLITIAKIALPLIIIIKSTLDLAATATSSHPEEFGKAAKKIPIRLIAAILVFLAPNFVDFVFGLVSSDYNENNLNCLLNITDEMIATAEVSNVVEAIENFEDEMTMANYNTAVGLLNQVSDENTKATLSTRLQKAKTTLDTNIQKFQEEIYKSYAGKGNTSGVATNNKIVYYQQNGEAYSYIPYGKYGNIYNMHDCGCGYASLSMVVDGLTMGSRTPIKIVNDLSPDTYASNQCPIHYFTLTSDELVKLYNVKGELLFDIGGRDTKVDYKKKALVDTLNQGYAIIVQAPGHFIALGSIKNGKISAFDPADPSRNGEYTIDELWDSYRDYGNNCTNGYSCGFIWAAKYSVVK